MVGSKRGSPLRLGKAVIKYLGKAVIKYLCEILYAYHSMSLDQCLYRTLHGGGMQDALWLHGTHSLPMKGVYKGQ